MDLVKERQAVAGTIDEAVHHEDENEDLGDAAAMKLRNPNKRTEQNNDSAPSIAVDLILTKEDLVIAYRQTRTLYSSVDSSEKPGNDRELQDDCGKCLQFLGMCEEAIRRLQVFTKGEEAEDINTEDLCYVLVNYYAGKLYLKATPSDPTGQSRLKAIQTGKMMLEAFLEQCNSMKFLKENDRSLFLSYQGKSDPPKMSREVKMERYKQSRATKKRLEEVVARLKRLKLKDQVDEDLERENSLLDIDCAIKNALEEIESVNQEIPILEFMAKRNLEFSKDAPKQPPPSEPLVVTRIDESFNMIRETMKSQVFRPSWRQPTMSLEEYAEIEMKEAIEREKREAEK